MKTLKAEIFADIVHLLLKKYPMQLPVISSILVNVVIVEMGATWSKKKGGMPENAEKLLFY